jgi:uncharacterized spore protein YtfJ
MMRFDEAVATARDAITVKRIYAEPYEHDGVTVIAAAAVGGGAGGGAGRDEKGQEGEGGGFGAAGRPAGAYVIKGGHVRWLPAVDPNRMVSTLGLVVIVYLLMRPRWARARARVRSS